MKGIIIENSLTDKSVIAKTEIIRTWEDGGWKLHEVEIPKEAAERFGSYLDDGPWYGPCIALERSVVVALPGGCAGNRFLVHVML